MPSSGNHLSEADRTYLKTGEAIGSYRPHKLENRIEKAVEGIPDRFDALFDDIELMAKGVSKGTPHSDSDETEFGEPTTGDYFRPLKDDAGYRAFLGLMGYDEPPTKQSVVAEFTYSGGRSGSRPAKFGARLGETVDYLMGYPEFGGIEPEDIVADLVWGFFSGLVFSHKKVGELTEETIREESDDLLERLRERAEEDVEYYERRRNRLIDSSPVKFEWNEFREEMAQRVGDIMFEFSSVDSRPIFSELVERSDKTDQELGVLCYDIVDYIAKRNLETCDTPPKHNAWKEFKKEHQSTASVELDELVTVEAVQSILREKPLRSRIRIQEKLESEAEELIDKVWRGVSAPPILHELAEEEPKSSKEIAKEIENPDYEGSVSRLAKDLAGQDCDIRGEEVTVWTETPILKGDATGWELTAYGRAVEYALKQVEASKESILRPIEAQPFPEELLIGALEEYDGEDLTSIDTSLENTQEREN